jgi:predicted enzyme related to lactoylglutathione lyase
MDIPDMGRAVVLADPTGAVFAIWQPKDEHDEALHEHIPGNRCWNELLTSNLDRGVKFYTELFGWKAQVQQMGPMSYTILMRGNDPIGGAMTIDKSWGNVPSNWMVYFVAKSCDEAVAYVKKEKGMVMMPPNDIPEVGRVAVVADPQGAAFGFVQPPPR